MSAHNLNAGNMEREEALKWWRSRKQSTAKCHRCNTQLAKNEGYLFLNKTVRHGTMKVNYKELLLCASCREIIEATNSEPPVARPKFHVA